MKRFSRVVVVSLVFAVAGLSLSSSALASSGKAKPAKVAKDAKAPASATVWPAGDIKWVDSPAMKGAKIAVLWGDPKTGAYGALKSLPGGSTLGMHTHTSEQRVVAVSGTILLSIDGGPAKPLGAGSYAHIPGGTVHTADCKAGAACIYFEEQPGASDIQLVAAPKK